MPEEQKVVPLTKEELKVTQATRPNGTARHTWAPQILGTKPLSSMNIIDRNGLGPWILEFRRANPSFGSKRISAAITQEFALYIGWRNIDHYLSIFRDPNTGLLIPEEKMPVGIPDRRKGEYFTATIDPAKSMAQQMHEILEEKQVDDVTALEDLAENEMVWFKDPNIPIPLKLKVAKELRETIKLKLEVAGAVKSGGNQTTNNNMFIDAASVQKILEAKPEAISVIRDLLYLAAKPDNSQPEVIEAQVVEGDSSVSGG